MFLLTPFSLFLMFFNSCCRLWEVQLYTIFFFLPLFYMQNGMTPLHLSVWYSIRSEDYATVKTLLEYNADCSAKDNVL